MCLLLHGRFKIALITLFLNDAPFFPNDACDMFTGNTGHHIHKCSMGWQPGNIMLCVFQPKLELHEQTFRWKTCFILSYFLASLVACFFSYLLAFLLVRILAGFLQFFFTYSLDYWLSTFFVCLFSWLFAPSYLTLCILASLFLKKEAPLLSMINVFFASCFLQLFFAFLPAFSLACLLLSWLECLLSFLLDLFHAYW